MRERRQKLKDAEVEKVLRVNRGKDLEEYLNEQDTTLEEFDDDLFRRLVEKIKVQSLVEVVFVFKTGVEVKEVLGSILQNLDLTIDNNRKHIYYKKWIRSKNNLKRGGLYNVEFHKN